MTLGTYVKGVMRQLISSSMITLTPKTTPTSTLNNSASTYHRAIPRIAQDFLEWSWISEKKFRTEMRTA